MKRFALALLSLFAGFALTACLGGPERADRLGAEPPVVMEQFLDGRTYALGAFERGRVLDRKFWVEIDGAWDAASQTLTLDEHFLYDDGQTQRRVWTMRRTGPNRFIGTAPDVIGEAEIEIFGDAAFFSYLVDLELSDGSSVRVRFDDRLYQMSPDVMVNRASVQAYGLTVGEVSLVFLKDRPEAWPNIPRRN